MKKFIMTLMTVMIAITASAQGYNVGSSNIHTGSGTYCTPPLRDAGTQGHLSD